MSAFLEQVVAPHSSAPKFMQWIEQPHVKWAVPIPLLLALAPLVWLFFRSTWRELDEDAHAYRSVLFRDGKAIDYRPMVCLALGAVILTLQEYYGGRVTYDEMIRKALVAREALKPNGWIHVSKFDELYALSYWATTRIGGYLLPLLVWKIVFRRDSVLDFGLRTRGFLEHAWIYAMFVSVMIPVMLIVSKQPDFGGYYPFYKNATRSWMDFLTWEALYVGQFFALEVFFRGWWVRACRSFGAGAIFCMVVPYCMIHYGKPYLEACGAIVAGTVLGSLSMKTKSIYAGFLVHMTVAILMDFLALHHRHALPTLLSPTSTKVFVFKYTVHTLWIVWSLALVVLAIKIVPMVRNWARSRAAVST
ncbi:MAG: CPBP family intramembrane glutamic endopeptidase [Polyangiales bacterium]